MKPDTAVELVGRYARLQRAINACAPRIAAEIEKCPGQKGFRLERALIPADPDSVWGPTEAYEDMTPRALSDQQTHLALWYDKDYGEPGEFGFWRYTVGAGDEETDCPHCYAAHLIVMERKALRRQLAAVKATMTRMGAPR